MISISERERSKYEKAWALEGYGASPGMRYLDMFWGIAKPPQNASLIDIGCGDGQAGKALRDRGLLVCGFDLVGSESGLPIYTGTVWRDLLDGPFDYGYCCDVMEHIPTQFTALSIDSILRSCSFAFFAINFELDRHGDAIRDRLHLTVQPFTWWRDMMRELGTVHEARDLLGNGVFYVER